MLNPRNIPLVFVSLFGLALCASAFAQPTYRKFTGRLVQHFVGQADEQMFLPSDVSATD